MDFIERFHKCYFYYLTLIFAFAGMAGMIEKNMTKDPFVETYEENSDENQKEYPELYENYEEYVKLIAEEIKDCSEERDILKDFAFYNTLLHNGFISLGNFEYSTVDVEFDDLKGANIAVGEGVCVNEAYNLCDVFNSLGYEAKLVVGKMFTSDEKEPEYNNHAIAYVSDGKKEYLLDCTNKTVFLRKEFLKYVSMYSEKDNYTYFIPTTRYVSPLYGEITSYELLYDLGNDYRKHRDVLKDYNEYSEAAEDYIIYFQAYEYLYLSDYEQGIRKSLNQSMLDGKNLN